MSLQHAMTAFVKAGGDRSKMDVLAWAETYRPATPDDVRRAWEMAKGEASQKPTNAYDVEGK